MKGVFNESLRLALEKAAQERDAKAAQVTGPKTVQEGEAHFVSAAGQRIESITVNGIKTDKEKRVYEQHTEI